ncbi:MAG: oxidoreductase [Citrobacter freundii]|nr:MAG: oxidoreductase [Citrobacter freundii]
MRILLLLAFIFFTITIDAQKLRVAVAGIDHGHVGWILGRKDTTDIELAGVYSADTALANAYAKKYGFSTKLIYADLNKMLDEVKPQAVLGFGSVFSHLSVVEAAAPRGIHVMVEKPMAVSLEHGTKMMRLAKKYSIKLLTNFETSWYPSVAKSFQLVKDSAYAGTVRKVVIHDGHQGPKEIGCSPEFLAWLTDPVLNGGGAITDFGCYGANLMTYLMNGRVPNAVTAVTRQFKPSVYPKVDDDATIILDYPDAQCIIQASWNWPYSRKDMEIYGDKGYVFAPDKNTIKLSHTSNPELRSVTSKDIAVYEDPFLYLRDVIYGKANSSADDLYSPGINMSVLMILDAAKRSAKTGKKVFIKTITTNNLN